MNFSRAKNILVYEIRRLISKTSTLIMAMFLPVVLVTAISLSLLPMVFGKAGINEVNVAAYYQDKSDEVLTVAKAMTEHKAARNFINVIEVTSVEDGIDLVEKEEVSAFIYVPEGFAQSLYNGNTANIHYYSGNRDKELAKVIYNIFDSGVNLVNYAQQGVDILYGEMVQLGYSTGENVEDYNNTATMIYTSALTKVKVYTNSIKLSPLSEYLPLEYYSISTLILALFFGATPVLVLFNKDLARNTLNRGALLKPALPYILIKILASILFLTVQMSVAIPIILLQNGDFGLFSGNVGFILLSVLSSGLYFSSIMLFLASVTKDSGSALWLSLSVSVFLVFISGLIVPSSILPDWLNTVAQFTGLPAIFRLFSGAMFGISTDFILINFSICFAVSVIFIFGTCITIKYRKL